MLLFNDEGVNIMLRLRMAGLTTVYSISLACFELAEHKVEDLLRRFIR
jgi:hypothetical protein